MEELYLIVWIFFIYAFLGWCTEVSYAALVTGEFVNRGFLNGPVCPVYGFGVVIVLTCLTPLADSLPLLFLGSVALTSALEWLTGFVLEKLFHQRWWDYSDQPFNLSGYICLRFSVAWGFACMFVVKLLHPTVLLTVRLIPRTLGVMLLAALGGVMAVDLAATVATIVKLNRRLEQIDELAAKIKEASGCWRPPDVERTGRRTWTSCPSGWRCAGRSWLTTLRSGSSTGRSTGLRSAASWRSGAGRFRSCGRASFSAAAGFSRPFPVCAPPGTAARWSSCAGGWRQAGGGDLPFAIPEMS